MFEVSIEDTLGKGKITFELVSHELSNDVTIVIPIDKISLNPQCQLVTVTSAII